MNRPHNIPVFIAVSFSLGTFIGFYISTEYSYWVSGIIFLGFIFSFIRAKRLFIQDPLFTVFSFMLFIILGCWITEIHQPNNNRHHYIQKELNQPVHLDLEIDEHLKSSDFQHNFIAHIRRMNHAPTDGKILLNVYKDSIGSNLIAGNHIRLLTKLDDISHPRNPYEFDYAQYMANKYVLKRAHVEQNQIYKLPLSQNTMMYRTAKLRNGIEKRLKASNFSKEQIELMQALLLGQRSELSPETYKRFADAGVVHVLAVSGLHIGIIVFFLMIFF